jgi:hypothetical protein
MAIESRMGPCARIGIIDGWVNVAEVHFAHEAINVQLPRKGRKSGLTVDTGEDMEGELLRAFYYCEERRLRLRLGLCGLMLVMGL